MALDGLNDAVSKLGGKWVKCATKADGIIKGVIVAFEQRAKTFEGKVVNNRTTGEPRQEWVFTLQTEDREDAEDDGLRKLSCNESAQRAVATAIRASGKGAEEGGELLLTVTEDPPTDRDQAVYQARYTPPAKALGVPSGDGEASAASADADPFAGL